MVVAVLGASPKAERFSHKAAVMLQDFGHRVVPVNPYHPCVAGLTCAPSLSALDKGSVDTVTVYMREALLAPRASELLALMPRRIIFNPGSEAPALAKTLREAGIECVDACTLVMLRSGAF